MRAARHLKDPVTTMVHSQWRWAWLVILFTFFASWVFFALFWQLIQEAAGVAEECVVGVEGFAGYFMLSLESQITIGFGSRYPTEKCPEGIFLLVVQVILGTALQGAMTGIIYAKMIRPSAPHAANVFAKNLVIYRRDGVLCLVGRVNDYNKCHSNGTQIKAFYMQKLVNEEGCFDLAEKQLRLEPFGFLLWPVLVVHKIVRGSPLYDMSAEDILKSSFEIVFTITGSSANTCQMTRSQSSYRGREILWGHRFRNCLSYCDEKRCYLVDSNQMHATICVDTPLCSAQHFDSILSLKTSNTSNNDNNNHSNNNTGGSSISCESERKRSYYSESEYDNVSVSKVDQTSSTSDSSLQFYYCSNSTVV